MLKTLYLLIFPVMVCSQPWNTWQDTKNLAQLNSGTQSLLRSSYCPYNCRFDRTSSGDTRFLRVEGGEAVIFEELNPGAITRIWMTSGIQGSSVNLDPNVRIKFYFDGELIPTLDMPLADLFNGNTIPFIYPLAADRLISSGGNYSYVPISYASGLKITLTNALDYKLWYQFNFQRLSNNHKIDTFNASDDLTSLANRISQAGDIWQPSDNINSNSVTLSANNQQTIYNKNNAGWVKSLKLSVDESYYNDIKIILQFDDEIHSQLSLSDFFALGQNNGVTTQSLFLGLNDDNELYSNFPMPFHHNASISLVLENPGLSDINVSFEIGEDYQAPESTSGIFGTQLQNTCPSTPLIDSPMFTLNKKGKWVGLFSEFSSIGTLSREYLEGDERIYIDGDIHPTHYGTGTEDFYNGGFYFDQGNLALPLSGSPYFFNASATQSITSAYRFMLTDGIEFQSSIVAKLENGAYGDLPMCIKSVAYFYSQANDNYQQIDALDLGSSFSVSSHKYTHDNNESCSVLTANFLDEPSTTLTKTVCENPTGSISFEFDNTINASYLRLRRLFDNNMPNQVADVFINNIYSGTFSYVPEKPAAYIPSSPDRRWQQESIELGSAFKGMLTITVVPRYISHSFNASNYQLLGQIPDDLIFTDSFE